MKTCRLLTLLCGLGIGHTAQAMDVYIVAGQSNGYRISSLRAGKQPIPNGKRIFYYGMNCTSEPNRSQFTVFTSLDPAAMGTTLALELVEQSNDDIVFIQYCRCGSGIWNTTIKGWYPGDDPAKGQVFDDGLFGLFKQYADDAKRQLKDTYKQTWEVKGLFWHQGESDSNGTHHLQYQKNLGNLLWRFRHELGVDLPIVCGEIRELTEEDRKINAILAQVAAADPLTALAKGADLEFGPDRDYGPDVHYTHKGCADLSERMAAQMAQLQATKK
jgi:predicted nucleic acid-binding Zn finger protein